MKKMITLVAATLSLAATTLQFTGCASKSEAETTELNPTQMGARIAELERDNSRLKRDCQRLRTDSAECVMLLTRVNGLLNDISQTVNDTDRELKWACTRVGATDTFAAHRISNVRENLVALQGEIGLGEE